MRNPFLTVTLISAVTAFLLAALASLDSRLLGQISLVIEMIMVGAVAIVPILIECALDLIRFLVGGG